MTKLQRAMEYAARVDGKMLQPGQPSPKRVIDGDELHMWAVSESAPLLSRIYGWASDDDLMVCASLLLDGMAAK